MDLLSEKEIDQINDMLVESGVNYKNLRDDLLDHVCCIVEVELQNGSAFSEGLQKAWKEFGIENLKLIEESTLYLLNQKLNKMKKFVSIVGIVSSLLVIGGVLFKINHIPGAGIMLVFGIASASLVCLPLMGYLAFARKDDKQAAITHLLGIIAAMTMSLGGLFKLMHWPLAMILFWIGTLVLLGGFIPMYSIRSYKLAENKFYSLAKSLLIVAGIVLFWGLSTKTRVLKPSPLMPKAQMEKPH